MINKQGQKHSPSQTLAHLEPQLNPHLKAGRSFRDHCTCPHSGQTFTGFPDLYRDVGATSWSECYEVRKTRNKIPLSEVTLQYGASQCGNQKKKSVPYLRSSLCASWHGFSALLESWTLLLLRLPKDGEGQEFCLSRRKNLPLLHELICITALSLAQYRCLTEHWENYRNMGQIQRQHQICWSIRTPSLLFVSSPILQKWLPVYLCQLGLPFAVTDFLLYMCCFFINSFAHIYLLHLH